MLATGVPTSTVRPTVQSRSCDRRIVWAVHLPHARDMAANFRTEGITYRQFLRTFPAPDVELAVAFSDFHANARLARFTAELDAVAPPHAAGLAVVLSTGGETTTLFCGAVLDDDGGVVDARRYGSIKEVLPLIGLELPHDDQSVEVCRIERPIGALSSDYRERVHAAAGCVARQVIVE